VGVFAAIALPLIAAATAPSRSARQALVTLDSAINAESLETREKILDVRKDEQLSSIPWLNRKLLNLEVTPHLSRLLSQGSMTWSAGRLMAACAVCFAIPAFVVNLRFNSVLISFAVGVGAGSLPIVWAMYQRRRRFSKFEQELPEALGMMVSALRAGHSLIAAMGLIGRECADPVGGEFKICFDEQNYGLEMKHALDNLVVRIPLQDLKIVATAIMIQKESGGNLAEVLDKTAHVIRERFRLKRQIMVHTAQGRMTGWILTVIPVVLGIAMYFVNPGMISILWKRSLGIDLLWGAAGLTTLGGIIIQRIVALDV
jgi:tight adherence protein B